MKRITLALALAACGSDDAASNIRHLSDSEWEKYIKELEKLTDDLEYFHRTHECTCVTHPLFWNEAPGFRVR